MKILLYIYIYHTIIKLIDRILKNFVLNDLIISRYHFAEDICYLFLNILNIAIRFSLIII